MGGAVGCILTREAQDAVPQLISQVHQNITGQERHIHVIVLLPGDTYGGGYTVRLFILCRIY